MTLRALLQGGGGQSPPAVTTAAAEAGQILLRTLLQDTAQSPPAVTTVGTGEPDQVIPSTGAIVGGVVGGLSGLTLCLAAALVFAVARIYGWRFIRLLGGKHGGSDGSRKQTDVEQAIEQHRSLVGGAPLPSIVTSRLARDSADEEPLGGRPPSSGSLPASSFALLPGPRPISKISQVSTSSASPVRTPGLRSDASWKDCLIEPEKIQILRRRDGKPWVLGGGAYGQVYKALYDGVQVVAAKVLTGLADERIFQSFVREAAILRDMRDKNIVQFVGVCVGSEEEGQPDEAMLIQEFMEAGSLFSALKWRDQAGRRVFGWYARGKRAAIDMARGLHYLHSHKIVHLDIKSSNVLLARDGTNKLADVGLARSLMTKTLLTEAGTMGTFAWSAPEVLTGQPCGTQADIYSFGIVLWEIVTGEIPNRGTMRNPSVPSECPAELLDLIDRCTMQDPRKRPTAKQIVQELEGMGDGTPSSAQARGAPLRSASLAVWRDQLPQQISFLASSSGDTAAGAANGPPSAGTAPPDTQQQPQQPQPLSPGQASRVDGVQQSLLQTPLSLGGQPLGGTAEEEEEEPGLHMLSGESDDLSVVAELAEEAHRSGKAPPPAPPPSTLRLEDLPPLDEEDVMFK